MATQEMTFFYNQNFSKKEAWLSSDVPNNKKMEGFEKLKR